MNGGKTVIDPRFWRVCGPIDPQRLVALTGARFDGPDDGALTRQLDGPASLAVARATEFSFLEPKTRGDRAPDRIEAGACFVRPDQRQALDERVVALLVEAPRHAMATACRALYVAHGFDRAELVSPAATIDPSAQIAPGVAIGPGAAIGANSDIGPGAVIGPGVTLGRDCVIGSKAVLMHAVLGDRVRIGAGAVIGETGFGLGFHNGAYFEMPHLGRVVIQDDVSIGANTTIDRGMLADTMIGEGTKIDNLVQIAHNVQIGRHCAIAAHAGISGSCEIGDYAQLGGRVGLADHVRIGARAQLAAYSGVMHPVPAGEIWGGVPAQPVRVWMRMVAEMRKLARARPQREGDE